MTPRRGAAAPPIDIPGRRLVVVDCETNGLYGDVRILSLAMIELRRGITYASTMWLMNPGTFVMDPGAQAVNGLSPDLLTDAETFHDHFDEISRWLTAAPAERLTLVGHKVDFDARHLAGEFARLGKPFPDMDLLDTTRLAEAVRLPRRDGSLATLLTALNLTNTAPHTSMGDVFATAAAATTLLTMLAGQSGGSLADQVSALCVPAVTASEPVHPGLVTAEVESAFTGEHLAAHLADISDGRTRRASLEVCLREACPILAVRMEDGIITPAQAKQVVGWALQHLTEDRLKRPVQGRLLRGLGQALRRMENPAGAAAVYRGELAPFLATAKTCTKRRGHCDRCAAERGVCDFVDVLRRCVDAVIHDTFDPFASPKRNRVEEFLPGYNPAVKRHRGRPPQGFYGELVRAGHLDAAGYGVARVAEVRRMEGGRQWAYSLLSKAWSDGCRTPRLAEMLASMTVVDAIGAVGPGADPRAPARAAVGYIDACLRAYPNLSGSLLDRLARRRERLLILAASQPRPERDMDKAVNLRALHPDVLGRSPVKLAPRSGRRQPSTSPPPMVFPARARSHR